MAAPHPRSVLALSGGVGGAKLALGLRHAMSPEDLTILVNTGDDFEHLGLHISPDIDTLLYVLSDRDDRERGWGRRGESWAMMGALRELGGETWFQLGDRDLATHLERTRLLREGRCLSEATAHLAARFGIAATILPMSDDPVRTRLNTAEGWLDFQPWFVGRRAEPAVTAIRFDGAETARLPQAVVNLLESRSLRAVVICPSNPLVSIDPILAVLGLRAALAKTAAPIVAVSPLIGGKAVKGPTAKMMRELGIEPGLGAVVSHYGNLLDGLVVDTADGALAPALADIETVILPTLMTTIGDRIRVARATLALADRISEATR